MLTFGFILDPNSSFLVENPEDELTSGAETNPKSYNRFVDLDAILVHWFTHQNRNQC